MLDRLFLSKLSRTGKIAYVVGQLVMLLAIGLVMFGPMGMSIADGQGPFILSALVVIVVWGLICIVVWPIDAERQIQ